MTDYVVNYRCTKSVIVRAPSSDQAKELAKKQLENTDEIEPVILTLEEKRK